MLPPPHRCVPCYVWWRQQRADAIDTHPTPNPPTPTLKTEANAALLAKELAAPKYAEYHLFFSNLVPPALLRSVAEADELDSVRQVRGSASGRVCMDATKCGQTGDAPPMHTQKHTPT